ncbi:TonB-dependent receptor [Planctobacterium marinum]|uniref:TonB-dependent receptor n=1 Tax=Planctobacterium marinum TaxID=1631968 RepID=A0AA48HQD5_9ALTE|nr:TonB-dependent receptor [Planctobacterium marinum]
MAFASEKIHFDIPALPANKALTEFALQANITLLFPYDLAEQESSNALQGEYSIELGIVKLLEGTGLYPVTGEDGQLSVRPIRHVPAKYTTATPVRTEYDIEGDERSSYKIELQETYIEKIAIVGTRTTPRNAIESSVPLDVISAADMRRQGNTDMLSMLSKLIPSFNVNDQPINDASTLIRPANLRGMASDHTLVLINGKRRHRSAVITFLGGGLSDGAQGPDIAAIPISGIKQVGVLRDGASAQYGSDAIAGVLNFALKDEDVGGMFEARIAQYYENDGEAVQLLANRGFSLGDNGFLNLSAESIHKEPTSRSVQRDDAMLLANNGLQVRDPAQIWGTPKTHYDAKLMANMGYDLKTDQQLYGFLNMAQRKVEGGFFYRNPQTRSGVNTIPIFDGMSVTNTDFNEFVMPAAYQWIVLDLTPEDGVGCPQLTYQHDTLLHLTPEYQQVFSDPNCFAFNEVYPAGFTPQFGGVVKDAFVVAGISGELNGGWEYDASLSLGYSSVDYFLNDSLNPSLGPASPTSFRPGGARQIEKGFNFDLKNSLNVGFPDEVSFAAGFEWRRENYQQVAGDTASWVTGPYALTAESRQTTGLTIGSNGFPGYRPESAGDWGRGNWATYLELETWLTENLLVNTSLRFEDYTDFGETLDGKVSFLAQANKQLALRGSINSGFKAPTVGQSNVINVTTAFYENQLQDQATLPPTHPISIQVGATPLEPEESINLSLGIVGQIAKQFYFTFDYFQIDLKDRISTTSGIALTDADLADLVAQGITDADRFASIKYFTNDFDTRAQGIDWVMNYVTEIKGVQTQFSFNYNWTKTAVERVSLYTRSDVNGEQITESNLTPQRIRMIEQNIPRHRASLALSQTWDNFDSLLRFNYYSGYYEDHLDASSGFDIYAGEEVTIDVELGYQFAPDWSFIVGANNLLDNRPDDNPWAGRAGALYPSTSPMGINGGLWYARLLHQF